MSDISLALRNIRDPDCGLCKLCQSADRVCELGRGALTGSIMVVSKMANGGSWQKELEQFLTDAGLNLDDIFFTQALRCRTFDQTASNADVKACRVYLEKEIALIKPKWILAFGNEALLSTTGKSGITKYRGKVWPGLAGVEVFATISPSSVKRNPGQLKGFLADLRLFSSKVRGISTGIKPPNYLVIDDRPKLDLLKKVLSKTVSLNFDVETTGDYYEDNGRLVSLSGTCVVQSKSGLKTWVFALPLYHPESPWKRKHRSVLTYLKTELESIPEVVAHNGSYDSKWMITYGVELRTTIDTMIIAHLLNENMQKGLKVLAPVYLGVEPWGIDTKDLLSTPLDEILEYNVLDTWYMYHLKRELMKELQKQPRLLRILTELMMPAQSSLVDSEIRGIWIDVKRLEERTPIVRDTLKTLEEKILTSADLIYNGGLQPEDSDWPKDANGKPRDVNLNASIFARWMLFDWLGLTPREYGKDKPDGSRGDPSMAEGVLQHLAKDHPVVPLMLERVGWQKYNSSFITPYAELYDEDHRIHTNFKLTGTVTGRLSSGKNDADKVTGSRGKIRGVNLQQVPRDPLIRGLFGAPPGWTFVEADYSQIELRIAAFLAREEHMLHLYNIGADIHLTTAARVTGLPESEVTKKIRKEVGKPVNFGFLYGMGYRKFIETAFNNYGAEFSEEEAKAARATYFKLYPQLLPWHAKQRRLANEYGRVQSPIGRIRHLPDIYSPEMSVRAEAERQSINCVTTDTEILTTQGWKTVDNLRIGDLILSPNPSTRELEIQPLTKINRGFYTGQAWQIDHNSISAITTPNHRWLVDHRSNGKYTTKFVTPGDFNNYGSKKIWVATEGLRQNNTTWSNDEVELMGWVLTDGHYKKQGGVVKRRLGVTQSKPRYLEEIKQLFNRLGKHSYRIRSTGQHVWEITSDQSARLIDAMPDKTLTPEVLMSLSHEQRELLFLTMCKGDGGWTDHRGGRFRRFHCGSEERANIFLMLCALIGQPARSFTRDNRGKDHYSPKLPNKGHVIPGTLTWHVELTKNKRAQPQHGSKWVDVENREVWCPTVQNGAWVAKRNNKVFITGNSPVQGFASDLAVLSMISINEKLKAKNLPAHCIGLVHDAINFEVRDDALAQVLPIIKDTMEDMSIVREKFGVHVDIPIIADLKMGAWWGDSKELSEEEIYDSAQVRLRLREIDQGRRQN